MLAIEEANKRQKWRLLDQLTEMIFGNYIVRQRYRTPLLLSSTFTYDLMKKELTLYWNSHSILYMTAHSQLPTNGQVALNPLKKVQKEGW
jgi:hypothetical protein